MKRKWNRLLALLLCVLMIGSELSGLTAVYAKADPAPAAPTPTVVTDTGDQGDFRSDANGRPNLFVSFLGDNNNYIYDPTGVNSALTPKRTTSLQTISVPAPYDQSTATNTTGPGNTWGQYLRDPDCSLANLGETVFWVGLGVDRVELLKLLESGQGLESLEAGFYYDSKVIEPYIDPTQLPMGVGLDAATEAEKQEAYRKTIAMANINNTKYPANTQWSSDYTVVRAIPGVEPPETDPVTREELNYPDINDILNNRTSSTVSGDSQWRMTYVSLELDDVASTAASRRLAGAYKGVASLETGVTEEGETAPIAPASAQGDQYVTDGDAASGYDYNYLLLIPFRLKNYGSTDWTPLRLVRDATHLSIGGGTWGVDEYGAWERTTTRNPAVAAVAGDGTSVLGVEGHPDRDLKLLTRFAGDLNLFTAGRTSELEYDALLRIIGDGGSLNHAKLTVDGDPAVWPVYADTNGDVIGGLQSGQGMRLDVHTQDNYVATVTVTYVQDDGNGGEETIYHAYNQIVDGDNDDMYKFVMPAFVPVGARRVTVTVTFAYQAGDNALIYLTELPQPGDTLYAVGNEATIRTSLDTAYADTANTETINSFSSTSPHPNYSHPDVTGHPDRTPVANAKKDQNVEIAIETHADYVAVVRVFDFRTQQFMTNGLTINATGASITTPNTEMVNNPAHDTDPTAPAKIPGPNYGKITMPQGGTIRLTMGSQDLDVEIAYEKGQRHQATLEVYNTNADAENFDLNTAQLVYDSFDELNLPSKAYSGVVYHDYDKSTVGTLTPVNDHRAVKTGADNKPLDKKLPWISASQAAVSGSLGGDTGRTGKTWNPKDLPTAEDKVVGGKTVMALLAGSAKKSDFQASVNGMDLAGVTLDDGSAGGLTGLRKNIAGELYGDSDVSAPLDADVDDPTVIDVLWEIREAIQADATTGGLKDTYLKTVNKDDASVAYTYYDLTPTQLQAYLLEVFAAKEIKAENDLAYRMASRRYLTVLSRYEELKKDAAYAGMEELKAPAKNLSTTVTNGKREYQGIDYKDDYLVDYDQYLTDFETYMDALEAHAGTGGAGAPTFGGAYPGATAPARKAVALLSHSDAAAKLAATTWDEPTAPEPIDGIDAKLEGNTIETRSGRRVYIVLEADSAYELDTANTNVFTRGGAPDYATGARITTPTTVTPVAVPGYKNVYSFIMPDQDCVVRVAYKLRDTRKLHITYKDAAGLDDNEAIVEVYSVADPAAVTPKLNTVTNKGYTSGVLPSGGSYDPYTDVYTPDSIDKVFQGSVVTVRGKAADGYEIKSVVAKNADDTTITVTKRQADDPADGDVYTFTVAVGRTDDISLIITYGPEVEEAYTATIQSSTEGAVNGGNKATWYVVNGSTVTTPTVQNNVRPGTHLVGHVTVAPGYYIKAVTASGASGDYSFTLTGDGYNNGFGTALTGTDVPIDIYVDMPHEDLVVDVVFAKGPPDPAPANTLTLIVKDDDNTETDLTKAAANWAKARVFDERPADLTATLTAEQDLPTAGALPGDVLGKNSSFGNGTLTDRKYVDAGKWVLVDFSASVTINPATGEVDPEKSYYVSGVTVGPDNLGAALIWEGPAQVSFYMPQGSTAVTVEFSKYPTNGRLPDYVLTVRETYTDLNTGATPPPDTDETSYITSARSQTIGRWSTITEDGSSVPGRNLAWDTNPERVPPLNDPNLSDQATGAATAGEEVTMTFDVDEGNGTQENPGWYYQSVVLVSNGAATRLTTGVIEKSRRSTTNSAGQPTTIVTYQVKFHMPASAAEFIVHYRKGPEPPVPDYAFTLTIDDPYNVYRPTDLKWDDNSVTAEFHDPTGAAPITHPSLEVGRNKASMTAVQHIHAGDVITLKTDLDTGYYLQYMIVNPAGLHINPVWTSADTATFVMPTEGVAVIAKVVKGTPQQYTANLILRYEDENGNEILPTGKTIHDIGRGTFVLPAPTLTDPDATIGSFDDYAKKAIYSTVQLPGANVDYDLYAFDGYYIDRVTIEPVILGVTGSLSGSCGYQYGDFTMPRASVNVNVWFKSGYPDEIPYDLTIKVHDSSLKPGAALTPKEDYNYAALRTVSGRVPAPSVLAADQDPVFGGQTKVIDRDDYVLDRDVVILDIHTAPKKNAGDLDFYVDASSIEVTDSLGNQVAWWYVPGGVAFVQPPRAVTAEITFRQGVPDNQYQATLHLEDFQDGDNSADKDLVNDLVLLSAQAANTHAQTTAQAAGTTPPPAAVNADGAVITGLYHGDALDLSVRPGSQRHVSAAYAVTTDGDIIPIYGYDAAGTTLTADRAQYVPGKPGTPATSTTPLVAGEVTRGAFAMPQSDVDVYVKFASGPVDPTDQAVNLVVSGPAGAGSATADIDEPVLADQTMTVSAPGMDSRFTAQGNETVVTFDPDTAGGYDIIKLEVTNNATGARVPYAWISVLQDPETIDNSAQNNNNLWPGVAPAPEVTHPGWKPNPKRQIRLEVPSGGVTVHVTYGKVADTTFRAQVVVNDPLAGTKITSKNNAWLSQQAIGDTTLKKLQEARPGEWVDLDITVHPGYRIEFVKVIPQSFGIVPGLPVGTDMGGGVTYYLHDQKTGFVMPNGDCTVYVKFVSDGIGTKSATLVVNGEPTGNTKNYANIQSPPTGVKGPVYVSGTPQSVSARPGVDWVTSEYYWDTATSSVAAISVTIAGTDTPVPFTQDVDPATGHGRITFPMSSDDVLVTITYQNDPTPVGQEVVLHVIDKDANQAKPILVTQDNYGRLTYAGNSAINAAAADTGKVGITAIMAAAGTFETTRTIHVPAGQKVDVTACSNLADPDGAVYIESAYVLFHQSGQMINFNLTPDHLNGGTGAGYSGLHDESSFTVHPGRNDVYVTLTRRVPTADEHAAVLMIRSPAEDTQSEAGIHADQTKTAWNDADPAKRDKVRANDPDDTHAYVVARDGDKVTISVEPASGYIIDYVQITPLGFPLDTHSAYHYDRTGNTITFDMPHVNVGITVYLKRGSNQDYTATLHFLRDPNCPADNLPQAEDYAKLSWTPDGQTVPTSIWADEKTGVTAGTTQDWANTSSMVVKEGSTVTLDAVLDTNAATGKSDVILSAFVVWKDRGSIVRLTPTYPAGRTIQQGLEGVTESASGVPDNDNTKPDATGTFTMPMGDVEVYVVVTTVPPTEPWHTVALVATDHSPKGNNSGTNQGELWNNTTPTDKRVAVSDNVPTIAWTTVTETETFSVLPKAGPGYHFDDPAVMTGNDGTTRNLSTLYANFLYEVSSILCNQVVRIDFESGDALELTVEIEDPDNPGDGTVEQVVTADPAGNTPPTLRLTSTSVAGSYQIISGIAANDTVELTATPAPGYSAYAQLHTYDGSVVNVPLNDADADGVWTGSFAMPTHNARVVITFYKGYTGTLTLVNRISGDTTGQATMKEDKRGLTPLTVSSLTTTDSFTDLPSGTQLDAQVISDMTGRKVTGLLTVKGSTTLLPATSSGTVGDPDHFYHTIDRADAEITLVLDDRTEHPKSYLAAVNAVNLPAGTDHPVIEDKTSAQTRGAGFTWTTADEKDQVEVTVQVPYGYEADIVAKDDVGTVVPLTYTPPMDGPASSTDPAKTHTATFPMPAANVQVTVTYRKVIFELTLRVVDTSDPAADNKTTVTPTAADVVGGTAPLTADGDAATVKSGGTVAISAAPDQTAVTAPDHQPHVVGVYYQTATGQTVWLQSTALADGAAYTDAAAFTMPAADTTVTVIYDRTKENGPVPTPEDPYYIATVEVVDPDNQPGNRAVSLVDVPDAGLPTGSPHWAAAYPGSGVKVSYEVQPGYYVKVTARRADNGDSIPVLQLGSAATGTGTVTMPRANVVITLTYSKDKPDQQNDVALQLIGHKAEKDNTATTTNATDAARLPGLTTSGVTADHAPHIPAYTDPNDPVETVKSMTLLGDDLRTLAGAAAGSQVLRMTVAVRKVTKDATTGDITAIAETPEVDLLVSKYMTSATSRAPAPITTADDEVVVIRVYYGEVYNATFHLVGADATDTHTATDVDNASGAPLTYTGAYDSGNTARTKPIEDDLDRIEGYQGDGTEDIQTTAVAGPNRRVVDVVWESDLTGAASAAPNGAGRYDFTMPRSDVDFYAIYEPIPGPDEPDERGYVAKVAFDPDSEHLGSTDNAVSIKNLTDTAAAGGKYWVGAKDKDEIEITVKVAPGYQAQVVKTKVDDESPAVLGKLPDLNDNGTPRKPLPTDDFQYYITRTQFIYNLPAGKTTTFTMPADTDATVTIKYTKGYDFTLDLEDQTTIDPSALPAGTTTVTNEAVAQVNKRGGASTDVYGTVTAQTETDASNVKTDVITNSVRAGNGPYDAVLDINNGGDPLNTVKIYPTAQHTIYVSGNESSIQGLDAGAEVTVYVETAPGYRADITVTYGGASQVYTALGVLTGEHTFTVPTVVTGNTVTVDVKFTKTYSLRAAASPYAADVGDTIYNLPGNLDVTTDVKPDKGGTGALGSGVITRVTRTTPFTGTQTVAAGTSNNYPFVMPYEDTLETVLLKNEDDPDNLLAKVELAGDSDVNGNSATPIVDHDTPAPATTTGTVWTTTAGAHVIDLQLSVAKGYVAKIKVRRDDSVDPNDPTDESKWVYLDAKDYTFQRVWDEADTSAGAAAGATVEKTQAMTESAGITEVKVGYSADALPQQTFPDSIGGEQHFRFVMPETRSADPTNGVTADAETDVTVIVTFEKVSDIPRPFDPRHDEDVTPSFLDQGFIYGENRGDFAVVEIPTLADDESETQKRLHDTDNYGPDPVAPATEKAAATEIKRFNFYLRTVADNGAETYTRLDPDKDILLVPYDEDALLDPDDPYNYYKGEAEGMWTGTELWKDTTAGAATKDFVGSKFLLYPTEPDAKTGKRTDGAQALYDMLNNNGSLETYEVTPEGGGDPETKYRTTLFVQAEDATSTSDYTQVWIRPWFALGVKVSSYGPTHPLTGELYRLMTEHELNVANGYWDEDEQVISGTSATHETPDPANLQHYKWDQKIEPAFTDSVVLEREGSGKWMQLLRIRSSDLLGGFDKDYDPTDDATHSLLDNVDAGENLTYALMLKKAANLTYTRIKLDLNPANYPAAAPLTDYYENSDAETRTFMVQDTIQLIAGDVNWDGRTKIQDYDAVYDFVYRSRPWTALSEEPKPPLKADGVTVDTGAAGYSDYLDAARQWDLSVYNPKTMAYRCDLDGDRNITVVDLNIVNTRFNYNRDETHYNWLTGSGPTATEILPYGLGPKNSSYVSLFSLDPAFEGELLADSYWDATVDPAETEAVPMETYYVDALGRFWIDSPSSGRPETPSAPGSEPARTHNERPETPLGEEALDHTPAIPVNEEAAILPDTPAIDPAPSAAGDDRAGEGEAVPEKPPASED